jgi:Nucleotidyl transferase AbiEii toxin, Type IV TA system
MEKKACDLMVLLGFTKSSEGMASRFIRKSDPSFPPVDLLWVSESTFGKMATSPCRIGRNGDIPVIDFESLLAMKLYALKDDGQRQGKDLLDIRNLLTISNGRLTEDRIKELCSQYAGPEAYEKYIKPNDEYRPS